MFSLSVLEHIYNTPLRSCVLISTSRSPPFHFAMGHIFLFLYCVFSNFYCMFNIVVETLDCVVFLWRKKDFALAVSSFDWAQIPDSASSASGQQSLCSDVSASRCSFSPGPLQSALCLCHPGSALRLGRIYPQVLELLLSVAALLLGFLCVFLPALNLALWWLRPVKLLLFCHPALCRPGRIGHTVHQECLLCSFCLLLVIIQIVLFYLVHVLWLSHQEGWG